MSDHTNAGPFRLRFFRDMRREKAYTRIQMTHLDPTDPQAFLHAVRTSSSSERLSAGTSIGEWARTEIAECRDPMRRLDWIAELVQMLDSDRALAVANVIGCAETSVRLHRETLCTEAAKLPEGHHLAGMYKHDTRCARVWESTLGAIYRAAMQRFTGAAA